MKPEDFKEQELSDEQLDEATGGNAGPNSSNRLGEGSGSNRLGEGSGSNRLGEGSGSNRTGRNH